MTTTKNEFATVCRGRDCNQPITMKRTSTGKWMPYSQDGTPHWATCQNAREFKPEKSHVGPPATGEPTP